MDVHAEPREVLDVREARRLFPATDELAYFNTAAVGLASRTLAETYHAFIDEWTAAGLDFVQGEAAAEQARISAAALMGARPSDVALIASVSSSAGLVAASFESTTSGHNVVIGEREYSSNHFPWRLLAAKGYEVRQVPFRNGGLEPDDVARHVDGKTRLVAFSGVQAASGHRSDIPSISALARRVGAFVFVDGSQMVGALLCAGDLEHVDVLATADHKFLLHAGRGMGYCYLSSDAQQRLTPINAGWRAGASPLESFFGPAMELSSTASRFDTSISWLAAVGNVAAMSVIAGFGADAVFARNRVLADQLRSALVEVGWPPVDLPIANRSTIVSVPLGAVDPSPLLAELRSRGIVASARDGNLRVAVHLYNHEDDIDQLTGALLELR